MKSELKETSPTQREIHLTIDGETLKEAYGRISKRYASRARVDGFRPGYAPLDVVRIKFKEEIKGDVLQDVIPSKVEEAIREHDLQPLTEPHLHLENQETVKVNGSEPLSLHVHFEVMPALPEPSYEGIELVRRVKPVEDGEVEDLINERLQREAALVPIEGRASEMGDTVIADLEGKFEDQPDGEPIVANDLEVTLGDEVIEQSFTDNLVGVKEDEEKEFTVVYPAEFTSEALAGKTVHYKAKVKSVGKQEVPELNDEWAKSLDEGYESLKDLRTRLKADLVKLAEADADARVRNNAIAKVIEQNPFEVPNALIENQTRRLLNDFARDMQQRGVDLEKVEKQFIEMAYHNMRQQGERDVKAAMLLDEIAKRENVAVSDEDLNDELQKMADYYQASVDDIRKSLETQGGLDNISGNLKTRKTIEAVVAKAKVTDGAWVDEKAAAEVAAQEEKPKKKPAKKKAAKKEG
ncbi:MAG: trigger factor [Acidobacteria bacterium]|nr:trigger factor [Acidobacteriota bacterium]